MGPRYDLSALWEQHTFLEFGARDAAATMTTMVAQPYVNHVPTMTGGVGHDELLRFYANHFIPRTPADTKLVPVSRTIGADRVVDEFLFCFTHDIEIDWMLPGIAPLPRRQAVQRTHLLGSGVGAGADRGARRRRAAGRRHRDGQEDGRGDAAVQHADGALGGQPAPGSRMIAAA
jgi:hypothetical protein